MVGPFFTLLSFEFFTLSPFPLSFERGFRFKKIRIERYDRSRSIDRDNYSINSIQLISSFDFRSNDIVINVCEYILVDCWSLWITRLFRTKISKMDKKIFRKVWRNRSSSNEKKKKKKKKKRKRSIYVSIFARSFNFSRDNFNRSIGFLDTSINSLYKA